MQRQTLKIISLNISEQKGTVKKAIPLATLDSRGIKGDAHAGDWNRQVSMLGTESIRRFSAEAGRKILPGEFAENLTTQGFDLVLAMPLDQFRCRDVILEVTQIGKKCHGSNCTIYREVGNCIMPKEGIFCKVVQGGNLKPGDKLEYRQKEFRCMLITMSDRASRGEYEDRSGPELAAEMLSFFQSNGMPHRFEQHIIPDDPDILRNLLFNAQEEKVDFILTTGGTGIGPRDITPEVVRPLLDKEIPGIMEAIRIKYGRKNPNALLTRSLAGVTGECLVFCLPGSEKAVKEYMSEIKISLKHIVYMLHGLDIH